MLSLYSLMELVDVSGVCCSWGRTPGAPMHCNGIVYIFTTSKQLSLAKFLCQIDLLWIFTHVIFNQRDTKSSNALQVKHFILFTRRYERIFDIKILEGVRLIITLPMEIISCSRGRHRDCTLCTSHFHAVCFIWNISEIENESQMGLHTKWDTNQFDWDGPRRHAPGAPRTRFVTTMLPPGKAMNKVWECWDILGVHVQLAQ